MLELYQVFLGIQVLAEWAEKTYRPWFEDNILSPLTSLQPVPSCTDNEMT